MRRTLAGLVAGALLAAGAVALSAGPAAAAATDCRTPSWRVVNPHYLQDDRTLVVGLTATTRLIEVSTGTEEGAAGVCTADSFAIQGTSATFRAEGQLDDGPLTGRATAAVPVPAGDSVAGSHNVVATLRDTVGATSRDYFENLRNVVVKRRMQFVGVNASPEPAAVNQDVHIVGTLQAASWTRHAYVGAGSKSVQLLRRTGTGAYATVATGTTSGSGRVAFVVDKGAGTECYALRYLGSPTLAAVRSGGDCVAQAA